MGDTLCEFNVVIPARFASTRLPGKPLLDIAGKPMVVWVAERAKLSGAKQVVVATDDERILSVVNAHGFDAVITQAHHPSGTDRIAEVVINRGWSDDSIVVNVQGDEPLIDPDMIAMVASTLNQSKLAVMATAAHRIASKSEFDNPNVVKVVLDAKGNALYFSRAPIPYPRDSFSNGELSESISCYRHVGIYAYRTEFLKQYATLQACSLEQIESLEQLRVLYHGHKIAVTISDGPMPAGVDTQQDLDYVRALVSK